jgi:ATP-dependent DNA helicase RecG
MRPALLDPLFAPATSLEGVGPKVVAMLENIVPADLGTREARVGDLLFVLPNSVIDRRSRPGIAQAAEGQIVTLELTVDRHQPAPRGKRSVPYRVYAFDETGEIALTFFHANGPWLEKIMPVGAEIVVSGRMEWFNGRPSMVHPDHIASAEEADSLPLIEPVYPLTAGLSPKTLRRAIAQALARLPEMPEWQDAEILRRQTFPAFDLALKRIHNPTDPIDASPQNAAWRRLAYDEFLAGQVALALVRARTRRLSGRALKGNGILEAKIRAALPYSLTRSQEQALAEIHADLTKPERMLRLLQGDVGSG